jgi:hypothetical protein
VAQQPGCVLRCGAVAGRGSRPIAVLYGAQLSQPLSDGTRRWSSASAPASSRRSGLRSAVRQAALAPMFLAASLSFLVRDRPAAVGRWSMSG